MDYNSVLNQSFEKNLRKRYETLEQVVNEGFERVRPKGKESFVEVGVSQMDMMEKIMDYFLSIVPDNSEDTIEAEKILISWAEEDRSESNKDPTHSEFFPTIIRGFGEKEFPIRDRPAVVTQFGMDTLLKENNSNSENGISPDEFNNAFISQIDKKPKIIDKGITCDVKGVNLKLSTSEALKQDGELDPEAGISYTEAWTTRWSEARRYTPFTMCSSYLTWIQILEIKGLSWDESKRFGTFPLYVGVLYLACEWACRSVPNVQKKKAKFDMKKILKAWRDNDTSIAIPYWMSVWRKPMTYEYVTANDVGYDLKEDKGLAEYSKSMLETKVGGETVAKTRMPFVERVDTGFPLQEAALTTMGPLRFFLGFSLALETCGSSHLPIFEHYYRNVLTYLGKNPGRVGRKLGKVVVQMARLIASDLIIETPTETMREDGDDVPFKPKTEMMRITDNYARKILAHNNNCSMDKESIALAICEKIPEIHQGLFGIFQEYISTEDAVKKYAVDMYNRKILDVITHLMHAGSAEGYVRSCSGSLPVSGYKSYTQRKFIEDIDTNALNREVDIYEAAIWEPIIDKVEVPTLEKMFYDMRKLSKATSAGGDRARFKVTRGTILGDKSDTVREGFSSNKKNVMHLTANQIIRRKYMLLDNSPKTPFLLGLRSVPARKLRYVYNLPIPHQIILYPLYEAMKEYMHDNEGYALAQKLGLPVYDAAKEINASIKLAHDPSLMCVALDASSLDQHIGRAHRVVQRRCLASKFKDIVTSDIKDKLDTTYYEMMDKALSCWDDSYYQVSVQGAPRQLMHVDTQPSGALTTAVDNTLVTMSILHMMQDKTKLNHLYRQVWGDDCYIIINPNNGRDLIELLTEQDEIGKGANQMFGTVGDSTSGRGVHFLQKLYIAGQEVRRRMAYDHENEVMGDRMPGYIGEYLDKARDLAIRGGNKELLNMLQIMTVVNGSRTTQFGRQASTTFNTIAGPGGTTNRVLLGFNSPNSKLYLQLNAQLFFGSSQVDIEDRIRVESDKRVGRRVLASDPDMIIETNIGGITEKVRLSKLQEEADSRLLEKGRLKSTVSRSLNDRLGGKGLERFAYKNSIRNGAYMAIGSVLTARHLKGKFREKALIESHHIATTLRGKKQSVNTTKSELHTGIEILKNKIQYSFHDDLVIILPSNSKEKFELVSRMENKCIMTFDQHWHPYYYMPSNYRYLLALLGVHTGRQQLNIKSVISAFSPGDFRIDLTGEEVMDKLKTIKSDRKEFLRLVGFKEEKVKALESLVSSIPLYEDISEAKEFASVPEIVKSCGRSVIDTLLQRSSPKFNQILSGDTNVSNVVRAHFVALLADELNVACTLFRSQGKQRRFIRIPKIDLV